jgi:hypothetical protein
VGVTLLVTLSVTSCAVADRALSPTTRQIEGEWSSRIVGAPFSSKLAFSPDGTFTFSDIPLSAITDPPELDDVNPSHGAFADPTDHVSGKGIWTVDRRAWKTGLPDVDLTFLHAGPLTTDQLSGVYYFRGAVFGGAKLEFQYGDPDDPLRFDFSR